MAVDGIANLVHNVADQLFGQAQDSNARTKILRSGREGDAPRTEDTFTPSTNKNSAQAAEQDAGIFQVSQVALTEVSANILFGQSAPNTNQNGATGPGTLLTNPDAGTVQTATGNGTPAQSAPSPADAANVQVQLQALNAALPALGLTNAQIQQIDRIASLIHDFNPAAFTNIVNQFEALAQQAAQQNSPITAASAGLAAGTNDNGFQVKEIFIHFVGAQETANNAARGGGGPSSAANNLQITAAGLQIGQVQFTFTTNNGQTLQVQSSLQNANAGDTNQQAPPAQVAAA
jgi:hypothetical protein